MRGLSQEETISRLTGLDVDVVNNIFDVFLGTVSHSIFVQKNSPRDVEKRKVDYIVPLSPYGELEISVTGKKLVCRFVPFEQFSDMLKKSIVDGEDLLENRLSKEFVSSVRRRLIDEEY